MNLLMFRSTQPATMEKQKQQAEALAWRTFIRGKGRERGQMAIGQ